MTSTIAKILYDVVKARGWAPKRTAHQAARDNHARIEDCPGFLPEDWLDRPRCFFCLSYVISADAWDPLPLWRKTLGALGSPECARCRKR